MGGGGIKRGERTAGTCCFFSPSPIHGHGGEWGVRVPPPHRKSPSPSKIFGGQVFGFCWQNVEKITKTARLEKLAETLGKTAIFGRLQYTKEFFLVFSPPGYYFWFPPYRSRITAPSHVGRCQGRRRQSRRKCPYLSLSLKYYLPLSNDAHFK